MISYFIGRDDDGSARRFPLCAVMLGRALFGGSTLTIQHLCVCRIFLSLGARHPKIFLAQTRLPIRQILLGGLAPRHSPVSRSGCSAQPGRTSKLQLARQTVFRRIARVASHAPSTLILLIEAASLHDPKWRCALIFRAPQLREKWDVARISLATLLMGLSLRRAAWIHSGYGIGGIPQPQPIRQSPRHALQLAAPAPPDHMDSP